jgi:PKD repeat protein
VDGSSVGAVSSYTFTDVTADHTIAASFAEVPPDSCTLAVSTAGIGTGSVALDPSGGTYVEGTVVTLTATADTGSVFAGWSGDVTGSTNPTTVTMTSNKTVTATFIVESGETSDFVCRIRTSGGDYATLSGWEAAIESDLTSPASLVFTVSDTGTYDPATDDGQTVTFTGGGTGTLKHVGVSGQAYIVDCAGTISEGEVTCFSGSVFTVSDAGRQIGLAIAECWNDWPEGLSDYVSVQDWTTDETHYVKIYAPEGQRHDGTAGTSGSYTGFTMKSPANWKTIIDIRQDNTRVEGISIDLNDKGASRGIGWSNTGFIDSCIVFNNNAGSSNENRGFSANAGSSAHTRVSNCIVYDVTNYGFYFRGYARGYVYNCAAVDCGTGFYFSGANSRLYLKNCLADGCAIADFGEGNTSGVNLDYCASSDATAETLGGEGNRANRTFTFADEAGDDFHLADTDTGAKDAGTDLSSDPDLSLSTDIDGDPRTGAWDIGADECVTGDPPENDPPVAVDDAASTDEDVAVTVNVLANDSDPDDDALSVLSVTQPANGSAVNNGGSVTYTPNAGYSGIDTFSYTVSDGNGGTNSATVTVTVIETPNTPPTAVATANPTSGVAPLAVTLDGTGSSDAEGPIVDYEWDLGDGESAYGETASHTYDSPGTYTCTLYVFDEDGAAGSDSVEITVTDPGGPDGITLLALDQNGAQAAGAEIYVSQLAAWYPTGTQVELQTGKTCSFRGRSLDISGSWMTETITETTVQVVVPFVTTTIRARDQHDVDVTGAQVEIFGVTGSPFDAGAVISLAAGTGPSMRGRHLGKTGAWVKVTFTQDMDELTAPFWTTMVRTRDQHGADVPAVQAELSGVTGSPFDPNVSVTLPDGALVSARGKATNRSGAWISHTFTDGLDELVVPFWQTTIQCRA